jgi:hypothetical protein
MYRFSIQVHQELKFVNKEGAILKTFTATKYQINEPFKGPAAGFILKHAHSDFKLTLTYCYRYFYPEKLHQIQV